MVRPHEHTANHQPVHCEWVNFGAVSLSQLFEKGLKSMWGGRIRRQQERWCPEGRGHEWVERRTGSDARWPGDKGAACLSACPQEAHDIE